jgi:tetratricopeptide (TPR) repeat protein
MNTGRQKELSMETGTRQRFMLLLLILLVVMHSYGCENSLPVLGSDPVADPLIVEDHSQALAHWAERGVRGAVLMNIDTHDDIRLIPDAKIDALRELYRRRDWKGFREADSPAEDGLYNIGNWIYAGARLGIFREVYWVIPFKHFDGDDIETGLRAFLASWGFSAEDVRSFTMRSRQFQGTFRGIPFTLCALESLPAVTEPLLLSVDTDFFPTYSTEHRAAYLPALHEAFAALSRMKYRIKDAVVSYSINGDFLHPHLRWVGDTIAMILRDPASIDAPPGERLLLLQQIDNAYRSNNPKEMLALADPSVALHPLPSLLLYKAYAHMLQGAPEKAYEAAIASCKADKLYCTGAVSMGAYYYSKGEYLRAERLFREAFTLNPDINYGVFAFANCLRKLGKVRESLSYYRKDERVSGPITANFMIVETQLMLGDREAAAAALKSALRSLESNPFAEITDATSAHAVYAAMDFCDRSGLKEMAAALRSNHAIAKMARDYPRR